jgi:hypothetical protein
LDVLSNAPVAAEALIPSARLVYTLPKLQDEKERHYATYQVSVKNLQNFVNALKEDSKIEYIHE